MAGAQPWNSGVGICVARQGHRKVNAAIFFRASHRTASTSITANPASQISARNARNGGSRDHSLPAPWDAHDVRRMRCNAVRPRAGSAGRSAPRRDGRHALGDSRRCDALLAQPRASGQRWWNERSGSLRANSATGISSVGICVARQGKARVNAAQIFRVRGSHAVQRRQRGLHHARLIHPGCREATRAMLSARCVRVRRRALSPIAAIACASRNGTLSHRVVA